ncbi:unnamed protein product [Knipowitschia caucasica]
MAAGGGKESHKWTVEQTKALIKFRADNEEQFTKKKYTTKQLWETAVIEIGLTGKINGQQAAKKWENLKTKYKMLKLPKTGSGTADGEQTASNWKFYEDMHAVLGGRPSIDPPVLVASFTQPGPTELLMAIVEPPMEEPDPSSTTADTAPPTPMPATRAGPSTSSPPGPKAPTTPSPKKRARRVNNAVLEFFKQESVKEQKRHEETESKTERFLSLFEKLVEKMPEQ